MKERDRGHTAEHYEFTLRKIDDACGVVDNIKPYCDDRIDSPVGDACNNILRKEFDIHVVRAAGAGDRP